MQIIRRPFQIDDPLEPDRVVRGRVSLPTDQTEPLPWVLVLHGFKGFMDWGFFPELCDRLARAGLAAVAFNTSASGIGEDLSSFSDPDGFRRGTLSRQLEDVERVRDLARSGELGPLDRARAGIFGHSRGGGVALVHAAEAGGYQAVVTWSALDDFDRWDEPTKALWRQVGEITVLNARTGQELPLGLEILHDFERNAARFDVLAACRRLRAPALLLHGSEDEAVSASALERLADALPAETTVARTLQGEGHTLGAVHPLNEIPPPLEAAMGQSVAWFARHLHQKSSVEQAAT